MRVAVVSDAVHPWHTGGKEVRYRELCRRSGSGTGIEVEVHTMRWWEGEAPRGHRALMRRIPMYRPDGQRSMLQAAMFALACLRMTLRRFDVIEADHMPGPQLFTLWAVARIRRVPLVVTWHEYWGREQWRSYLGPFGAVAAALEWLGTRTATRIIAVSETTRSRLIAAGVEEGRITLAPNGVHAEAERSATRAGMVCFGRLAPHKRVDLAIKTVAELKRRNTATTLIVIGDGPERGALEDLARSVGVSDLVEFAGELPDQRDVWRIVAGAEVCIMPSEREGFGIAVAESLILGTAVVTSGAEHNAAKNLIEDGATGIVLETQSPEEYADAVLQARGLDPEEVARRFRSGHRELTWEETTERVHTAWREAVR